MFLIFETLNCFSQIKIFIRLDIISIFNKLYIRKKDKILIVFCICFNFFEYFVIFFDLYNKFVLFQKYINNILRKFLDKFCIAYLNNILIYSNNKLEYEIYVKFNFRKLREVDLQADIIKYKFYIIQVLYLELIIIIEEIKIDLVKIDIIVN